MRTAEPEERDDPLNRELDALEAKIEDIVARGAAAPLRARLARLLNAMPTVDSPPATAGQPRGAS